MVKLVADSYPRKCGFLGTEANNFFLLHIKLWIQTKYEVGKVNWMYKGWDLTSPCTMTINCDALICSTPSNPIL